MKIVGLEKLNNINSGNSGNAEPCARYKWRHVLEGRREDTCAHDLVQKVAR